MGYRSEVKYILLFKTEEQLNTFRAYAQLTLGDTDGGKEILDHMDIQVMDYDTEFKHRITVQWDDVKWYESYPWVQMQEGLMDYVGEMDGCAYAFARSGEEHGDVETKASDNIEFHDYMDVRTSVDFV
jgi:hypothetical protein